MQHNSTSKTGWASIEYYEGGVQLRVNHKLVVRAAGSGGKRGKVTKWTKASRCRMREFMLTSEPEGDVWVMGASFTIPGAVLPVETIKSLWADWCMRANKDGWSAVWRMEIQKRGQVHWHCLIAVPKWADKGWERYPEEKGTEAGLPCDRDISLQAVRRSWLTALSRVGPVEYGDPVPLLKDQPDGIKVNGWPDLSLWPGAEKYAASVELDSGKRGAWMRYMQDHASKAKQEQIGEGIGRHWGVIGRKRFKHVFSVQVDGLTNKEFFRFLRAYQRLCTPVVRVRPGRDKWSCPFGRHVGFRVGRGRWGRSVWFSRPETVKRLAAWAKEE